MSAYTLTRRQSRCYLGHVAGRVVVALDLVVDVDVGAVLCLDLVVDVGFGSLVGTGLQLPKTQKLPFPKEKVSGNEPLRV